MKASELRIGNWVGMQFNSWCLYMDTQINDNDMIKIITEEYDFFEPIPLTEEWLLKFGFEYISDYESYIKKFNTEHHSDGVIIRKNDFVLCDIDIRIQLKHVHQLQNLYFALTGDELKINDK
jgi:hypothetical protein